MVGVDFEGNVSTLSCCHAATCPISTALSETRLASWSPPEGPNVERNAEAVRLAHAPAIRPQPVAAYPAPATGSDLVGTVSLIVGDTLDF